MNEKVIAVDISDNASKNMRKIVFSSLLGNALEWYDFFLYGTAAALVFGPLFFPAQSDPLIGTLLAFSGFAIGFIARPLGGIFFGHIGDKYSHKMTLIITLVLMGASTFIIGVLPTYPQAAVSCQLPLCWRNSCRSRQERPYFVSVDCDALMAVRCCTSNTT